MTKKSVASAIPVGTQFSPNVVDLASFLTALVAHSGNREALLEAIWQPEVRTKVKDTQPTKRNRSLPLEAAIQYGLMERGTLEASQICKDLATLEEQELYVQFAQHILMSCGGLRVVEATQQMHADNLPITGDTLARYLSDQGFPVTEHNTAINTMRLWLAKAKVFPEGKGKKSWKADQHVVEDIVGMSSKTLGVLIELNEGQRAFLEAICKVDPDDWYAASAIREIAEQASGLRLSRMSLPKEFLSPLATAGLLEYKSGGTKGGKSAVFRTTEQFRATVLDTFIKHTVKDLDAAVSSYYTKRPADIYAELKSKDTFKKGQALEAYTIYLMRLLGLRFVGWRKQARETTGRAEVDAVLTGVIGAVPTTWQVQCKNTPSTRVDLEDVAKEVGLLPITRATHVLVVANCPITGPARDYAREVMQRSPVTVFLLDRDDFIAIEQDPGSLARILRRQAEDITRNRPKGGLFHWQ